ncbi:MAG: PIN domain-containing protein [Acidobacteria bacterium]|nr:PIN domain-containing protein [Acidobacteriota bacterium]
MSQFLDTNVLLYSISGDPRESGKRERAIALLEDDSSAISVQVLQEFYVQATRASRDDAIPHELAAGLMEAWTRLRVQEINLEVLMGALRIRREYGYSYWDSAILSAAVALGCERVWTEDMAHGQVVEGVTVLNPFL